MNTINHFQNGYSIRESRFLHFSGETLGGTPDDNLDDRAYQPAAEGAVGHIEDFLDNAELGADGLVQDGASGGEREPLNIVIPRNPTQQELQQQAADKIALEGFQPLVKPLLDAINARRFCLREMDAAQVYLRNLPLAQQQRIVEQVLPIRHQFGFICAYPLEDGYVIARDEFFSFDALGQDVRNFTLSWERVLSRELGREGVGYDSSSIIACIEEARARLEGQASLSDTTPRGAQEGSQQAEVLSHFPVRLSVGNRTLRYDYNSITRRVDWSWENR